MAWTYTQNFDSLTDGDLNGQDSWSGDVSFDVQTTTVLQGTKSIGTVENSEVNIDRTITAVTEGIVSCKLRLTTTSNLNCFVQFYEGASYKFDVGLASNGNAYVRGATNEILGTFSANTTHTFDAEFDVATDQVRGRLDGGTWSAWVNFASAATQIDKIKLSKQNNGTQGAYFDDIKSGAVVATVPSKPTLLTLNVG